MGDERSQELFEALESVRAKVREIEEEESRAIENPELQQKLLRLTLADRILSPNDGRIGILRAEIEDVKETFKAKREAVHREEKTILKELTGLTMPAISRAIELLHRELRDVPALEEKKLSEYGGGSSMIPTITLTTNRAGILAVKKLVNDAVKALREMVYKPVSEIEAFTSGQLEKIKAVDLSPHQETVLRSDYERQQFVERPKAV